MGARVVDPSSDLTSPLDDERINPLASIRQDDSDASIKNKDLASISNLSPDYANILHDDQLKAIHAATANLTEDQVDTIQKRNTRLGDLGNAEAGSSKDKGKGIDPHNWGNIEIPDDELNFEAQRRALEEARHLIDKRTNNPKATSTPRQSGMTSGTTSRERSHIRDQLKLGQGQSLGISRYIRNNYDMNREYTPAGIHNPISKQPGITRPIDLVNPKSYLGVAFNEMCQRSAAPETSYKKKSLEEVY
ncbi:hypothetical protein AGABI1DRAFT_133606 [Agaricus bisporus var. burnettii JB137-S8]|uniref:Uncharacterized protein n=1 Tax=Agaricus bisporus var. burnettii (strain JB137-S8 / ATCC MYA-4627 / FGSC 10392) TaxID=597362 RepID=K5XI73_AGABU|nr:uncharacterized protein AGABI1DRAFT_133606 [Agaricus bisporus var. burnettii JB137-S8]EKM74125.1 hypothetical protein AGABI1DRAFT_133606 [Agaricus bisporus var. burnettii JB137-S8]